MEQIIRIGMDTSKHIFQLHGVNGADELVLRKKLRRKEMMRFFEELPPTRVAIEACASSHHWARLLESLGHEVKLIPPQFVKPYVKRNKNDAADAEALCEAMSRPTMRFVPVKTAEQQAALMLVGVRERLIRNRTQLSNTIRGYATEFGLTASKGFCRIEPLLKRIAADGALPTLARELFDFCGKEYAQVKARLEEIEVQTDGLASRRRLQPAPSKDSWHRPNWRVNVGHENTSPRDLPIRAALRRLAWFDTQRSFDCGKIQARRDYPRR